MFLSLKLKQTNNNYSEKYDSYFAGLLGLFLIINSINLLIKQCFLSPFIDKYLSIILGLFFAIFLSLFYLKYHKLIIKVLVFEFIFAFLVVCSILLNGELKSLIIGRCVWTILFCIPLSLAAFYVTSWEYVLKKLKIYALVCLVISGLNIYYYHKKYPSYYYNMSLGYSMLIIALLHLYYSKNKPLYYLISLLDIVLIALFCSRGPLLCIIIYFAFTSLIINRHKYIVLKICSLFFIIVCVIGIQPIINGSISLLNDFGIKSRILEVISTNGILYDSGRTEIYESLLPHVFDNPIFGLGVCGELNYISSSPHQVFLEFLLQYGVIVGGFLSVSTILLIILTILQSIRNKNEIIALLVCGGFVKLLMSSTYLESPIFWILISVCIQSLFVKKNHIQLFRKDHNEQNNIVFIS